MGEKYHIITVYGGFLEPLTGLNFIFVKIPNGRIPWARKIAPAINRLVNQWYLKGTRNYDRFWNNERHWSDEEDADDFSLWDRKGKRPVRRYEWDGLQLVEVK